MTGPAAPPGDAVDRAVDQAVATSTESMGATPSTSAMPHVLHSASVAVLMLDVRERQVVYANATGIELTGGTVRLPVSIRDWADAAGLTDLDGEPFADESSPLARIAAGETVTGEPVALHSGAPLVAGIGDDGTTTLAWVTGFALADAGGPDQKGPDLNGSGPDTGGGVGASRALAVLLPLADSAAGGEDRLTAVRDRAVLATEMSFTISDAQSDDDPLAWVNPSFERLTGYSLEEVVGTNCRFLQGPNTDRASVRRIREALDDRRPITEVLLNYRRDGTAFWNQITISPVLDGDGELVNFVGVQSDVTERVIVEQERRAALADAEAARAQLRLLAEATTQMTAALDTADACTRLARIVVPELADLATVDLIDAPGGHSRQRMAVAARESDDEELLRRFGPLHGGRGDASAASAAGAGRPHLVSDLPESGADQYPDDPDAAEVYERLRLRSAMVVPLRARGRVLGTLTLYTQFPYGSRYGQRDLHLAADLAGRAGLAVDNARLYEVERAAAATLQHSLLPAVPDVPGLQIAARYLVGKDGNQVGGDWYDVLPLPGGYVGAAVGDVVGHDLSAAAAMGQLRGVLRSYAWGGDPPGSVLDRCDQLVQGLDIAAMATAVYAVLGPVAADGSRELSYANAGHPAPLLREPDGTIGRLDAHHSPMLGAVPEFGVASGARRDEVAVTCAPGSLLVFYTDGLTDIAGEDADERAELIERTVAAMDADASPEDVVERTLEVCLPEQLGDDVALLAIRLTAR
ncbi:PAS domain S-box-containing protein [Pseudonocardia endophytica]|uniref:PAS domain S-box-containing protein n=2 Tax=Pseudonocardia endophytica TaxID=401976 RepID=A0A4R1HX86_PSEEN|nr:PAS domain S-box-containing protein [Pseudonocardia endophytica]